MNSENRKHGPEQHYAATAKVYVARATDFALALDGCTDLLDDVCYEAGLLRVDFGNVSLELDHQLGLCIRRY